MSDPFVVCPRVENPYALLAFAVGSSFAVCEAYPILGPFIKKMKSFVVSPPSFVTARAYLETHPDRTFVRFFNVDRDIALDIICERYNLTVADVVRVEAMIDSVTSLPMLICDPVFPILAERDYS
jgi:hypothetical protein